MRSTASLGRAPSTVSREISRNGGRKRYRASRADQSAWDRAHRPKTCKLVKNRALARVVARKLRGLWSPESDRWLVKVRVSGHVDRGTLQVIDPGIAVKEMADHQRFRLDTDIRVYFCDPRSPWQRGSNENTNGLLRQYFPKGMDLSDIHQNRLNAVARQLNERPRKTLDFRTPAERFNQCVASIG